MAIDRSTSNYMARLMSKLGDVKDHSEMVTAMRPRITREVIQLNDEQKAELAEYDALRQQYETYKEKARQQKENGEADADQAQEETFEEIVLKFPSITEDGIMERKTETGLTLRMDAKTMVRGEWRPENRASFMKIDIHAIVESIDSEHGIIHLRSTYTGNTARSDAYYDSRYVRSFLDARLAENDRLEKAGMDRKPITVNGTVTSVNARYARVRIAGTPRIGRVSAQRFTWLGTSIDLREKVQVGDVYMFNVLRKDVVDRDDYTLPYYVLSHREFTDNPWKMVSESVFEKGTMMNVKCTFVNATEMVWRGVSVDGTFPEGFQINGAIIRKKTRNADGSVFIPEVGKIYRCTVIRGNASEKNLWVAAFRNGEEVGAIQVKKAVRRSERAETGERA